jgi:copper chaperone NosL
MMHRRLFVLGGVTFLLTACGGKTSATEPPKIAYGKDLCARCRMIISEERFAGGLVESDGDALLFDDPGELVAQVQEEGLNDRRVWVHDYTTKEWIDGTQAYFVVDDDLMTPMGTGVVALKTREEAERLAAEKGGQVMTWQEIVQNWKIGVRMS